MGIAVQLSIIEAYGIMIFRCEKEVSSIYGSGSATSSGSGGKIYVFRLSELEEYLLELMEWHHNVDSLLHNENNDFQVIIRTGTRTLITIIFVTSKNKEILRFVLIQCFRTCKAKKDTNALTTEIGKDLTGNHELNPTCVQT